MFKMKKVVAAVCSAAMVLTAMSVSVAARGTNNWAEIGTSRMLDFQNLVSKDISTMKGEWIGASLSHANDAAMHYDAEKGVFGKAADDVSLHIWNDPNETYSGSSYFENLQLDDTNNMNEAGALKVDQPGEGWDINFDFAYNGTTTRKVIMGASWSPLAAGGTAWDNIFYVNGDGTYGVMNTLTGQKLDANKWYNIDIKIFKTSVNAENLVEIYVDGNLVKNFKKAMSNKYSVFQGFKYVQIGNNVPTGNASQSDLYLDNFRVTLLDNYSASAASKKMDFSEAENGRKSTWNGDFSINISDGTSGKSKSFKTDIVSGVMGRSAADRTLRMYNDPEVETTSADSWGYIDIENKGNVSLPLSVGNWHKTSFSISVSDTANVSMTAFLTGSGKSNWDKGRVDEYFTIKNGGVNFYGKSTGAKVETNKFYKFDIVTYSGKNSNSENLNKVKVYMDNNLIYENDALTLSAKYSETLESFQGIYRMWFGSYLIPTNTAVGSKCVYRDFYLDDFSMSVYETEPVINSVNISSTNSEFSKYMTGSLNMYVDSDAKWDGSFVDKNNENAVFSLKNSDGTELETGEAITGKCYYSVTSGDDTLYGIMTNGSKTALDEKFGNYADGYLASYWDMPKRKYTTFSYPSGVGGRNSDDFSFKIGTEGYSKDELVNDSEYASKGETYLIEQGAPYVFTYTVTQSWTDKYISLDELAATHIEYSIFLEGNDWYETNFKAYSEKSNEFKPIVFKQDGTVRNSSGNVIGEYNKNQWLKVEVSLYPANFTSVVKLNGKKISEEPYFPIKNGNMRMYRMKMEQCFSPEDGAVKSGAFYIDDLKAYQGSYQAKSSIDDLKFVSQSDDIKIYNGGAVILNDDQTDAYNFSAEANVPYKIYQDITCKEEIGEFDYITDGNVFVLSDGNIYKYYLVLYDEELAPASFELDGIYDKSGNNLAENGADGGADIVIVPRFKLFKGSMPLCAVVSQYTKDGKLLKTKISEKEYNEEFGAEEYVFAKTVKPEISFEVQNVKDSVIKVMFWDGFDIMKPYTESTLLKVNMAE